MNQIMKFNESYVISNISAQDVENIYYAGYGQDICDPLIIYILQKDGTVKGIDVTDGCKNGYFVADDIAGLKNVDRIENVNACQKDDSGSITIIAITKDNKIYWLNEYDYTMSRIGDISYNLVTESLRPLFQTLLVLYDYL